MDELELVDADKPKNEEENTLERQTYFPDLDIPCYLNHAAMSPLPQVTKSAMVDFLGLHAGKAVLSAVDARVQVGLARTRAARLLGAQERDIAFIGNTSQGLTMVAQEFPWEKGNGVVLFRGEFPSNILPWLNAAKVYGFPVHWLDLQDLEQETPAFRDVMAGRPSLLALSWVQFQTGRAQSLEKLAALRSQFGVAICLDAIQGLGALMMDLAQHPLDFVVAGGHKWLMSPEGTGLLYVHPDIRPQLKKVFAGWLSQDDPLDFLFNGAGWLDYNKAYREDASRFEMATMNSVGLVGMAASLGLLLTLGPSQIQNRVLQLAVRAREGLRARGLKACDPGMGSGIASAVLPQAPLKPLLKRFESKGVVLSVPDGHIRVSPHFYNTEDDIDYFLECVDALVLTT